MKYGFFDDAAREYVIHTPQTPLPWINYLGSEAFFSLISNTAGGYSFYKDARLRRITRYRYNNVPADGGGRMYYICDGDAVWNPGYLPCKTPLDRYACRHGLGYTVFEAAKNGLSAGLTCFVPLGVSCEVNRLTLRNDSPAAKTVTLFSAMEWCLWDAVDDSSNFQRNLNIAEVEVDNGVLYHKTEYRERRDHYAFFGVNREVNGFDTDRDAFLGAMNGWDSPEAVTLRQSGNTVAHGGAPMAGHMFKLLLAPGEQKSCVFVLGYVENERDRKFDAPGVINKEKARAMLEKFATDEKVELALGELAAYWDALLGRFQVSSPDDKLDRMVNIWNQYQCMVTFNMSRSASYYESGIGRGMGFRDSCQDLLGFVHLIPERARERVLDIAAIQREDGSTWHQYQPLTKRGNAGAGWGFNDDPLWLVACVSAYIRETGDDGILREPVAFDNAPGTEAPLFEHLRRSIHYTLANRGPHGLPLIGRADWNDCLNLNCFSEEPGESFQTCANYESGVAESVFIAGMFVLYGREYAELCRRFGRPEEAFEVLARVADMERAIVEHGWDGAWFVRAYDAFGQKVGSKECEEGQIYIEPQGLCAMARIGLEQGYPRKALDSVKARLTTPYGTCLLAPCYSVYHKELGEVSSYPPGFKENGSIFCHNNPWISIGEALNGNEEEAFAVYRRTCPAYLEDISEIHRTEPYVYSQTIAGAASPKFGQARNSWLTGTAAWTFVNASQYILGIRPEFDGLSIDPRLPASIETFSATRLYRGVKYVITVKNSGSGDYTLFADGSLVEGNVVTAAKGAGEVSVLVTR